MPATILLASESDRAPRLALLEPRASAVTAASSTAKEDDTVDPLRS
jgi:hypothetical protein